MIVVKKMKLKKKKIKLNLYILDCIKLWILSKRLKEKKNRIYFLMTISIVIMEIL